MIATIHAIVSRYSERDIGKNKEEITLCWKFSAFIVSFLTTINVASKTNMDLKKVKKA